MLYLKEVVGGKALSYLYAVLCFFFSLMIGNAMQANSIRISVVTTWGVQPIVVALAILAFAVYILAGGAARIVRVSNAIVPIKVGTFFISTLIILVYHYAALWDAMHLIVISAFRPQAAAGGLLGFSVQQAMRYGMVQSIAATESGLGTAAILFGSTGKADPMRNGLVAMISTFVSTGVCFILTVCMVASGVWQTDLTSTALTIAAFSTVFGGFGGWIVSFLSISFGIGVLVAYAYITRAAWLVLTNGRFEKLFMVMYCAAAFAGAMLDAPIIWGLGNVVNGCMLAVNVFGLLCLVPVIARGVKQYNANS